MLTTFTSHICLGNPTFVGSERVNKFVLIINIININIIIAYAMNG